MTILSSLSKLPPRLGLLLVLLTASIRIHAMVDGEIVCDQQKKIAAEPMQKAIGTLLEDPELVVCAFNDGGESENFPAAWDLDRKDIAMPQNTLRTPNKGWTLAGNCTVEGGNAGIWLQTYRWGAPHFCQKQKEIAHEAQAILDKCTYKNGDGDKMVRGTLQTQYEMWVELGESNKCEISAPGP